MHLKIHVLQALHMFRCYHQISAKIGVHCSSLGCCSWAAGVALPVEPEKVLLLVPDELVLLLKPDELVLFLLPDELVLLLLCDGLVLRLLVFEKVQVLVLEKVQILVFSGLLIVPRRSKINKKQGR